MHTEIRKKLVPEFRARRITELRPSLEMTVASLLEGLSREQRPVDLVTCLIRPAAYGALSHILGTTVADHVAFDRWSRTFQGRRTPSAVKRRDGAELMAFMRRIIAERTGNPCEDLPSRLIGHGFGGVGPKDPASILATIASGGYETTSSLISTGLLALLAHPSQAAALDDAMIASAVQEAARYVAVIPALDRIASAEAQVGGAVVGEGDLVRVSIAATTRDAREFSDADIFDVQRRDLRHLGFGYGSHHCLGRNIAETLFEIIIRQLFLRFPSISLVEWPSVGRELMNSGSLLHSARRLLVTW
ncbi:cytochrome P450 [Streptomyces sp. NPDC127084]|uniref:cytochrome P450 n=1 Tax=Streptomyces sp. NPDC127084 TaxID=3347133 RepID=UPI00364B2AC0